jgi:hypothetical protein
VSSGSGTLEGMPLRNRVTPVGELVADAGRGLVYGNRGCLHDARGEIVRWAATRRWIACRLRFKDWHRSPLRQPGRFTELFFLDEATAFAAGHRPCALCRRADYLAAKSSKVGTIRSLGDFGADELDAGLEEERMDGRERRLHRARFEELPDGAFVIIDGEPSVVFKDMLLAWAPRGYGPPRRRPIGAATLLTPPSLTALLREGWHGAVPLLHPTATKPR